MHALYELKEILMSELEEYGKKGELSAGSLEIVDKLCHAIKNLDKIIMVCEDDGYSNRNISMSYRNSYYGDGKSYARSRDSRGRYSGSGYSRHGDLAQRVRGMMAEAPDERTRQEMESLAMRLEDM